MEKMLKRLFAVMALLCIPVGFFIKNEHGVFFWHKIPSVEAVFGFVGTFLLILATAILAFLAQRKEDFYD